MGDFLETERGIACKTCIRHRYHGGLFPGRKGRRLLVVQHSGILRVVVDFPRPSWECVTAVLIKFFFVILRPLSPAEVQSLSTFKILCVDMTQLLSFVFLHVRDFRDSELVLSSICIRKI